MCFFIPPANPRTSTVEALCVVRRFPGAFVVFIEFSPGIPFVRTLDGNDVVVPAVVADDGVARTLHLRNHPISIFRRVFSPFKYLPFATSYNKNEFAAAFQSSALTWGVMMPSGEVSR